MRQDEEWWKKKEEEVVAQLETDLFHGLSPEGARRRLRQYGPNRLPERKGISPWQLLLSQFTHFVILFLFAVTLLAGLVGEWTNAIAIGVVLIINAVMGFVQEYRAERAVAALKKLSSPLAFVVRGGKKLQISSEELVPGDLLLVEAGDHIPADGRIVRSSHLRVDEATLTGESIPLAKNGCPMEGNPSSIGDYTNLLFRGTSVVQGTAACIVTETGERTELGRIATLLVAPSETKNPLARKVRWRPREREQTPLQVRLAEMGRHLVWICLFIVAMIWVMSMLRNMRWTDALITSLSLAVAAVPEGLPAVVTIALSAGMWRLARKQVLVRRLTSVETLGCTRVICTDKTGTLTKNEMTVTKFWIEGQLIEVTGKGYLPEGTFSSQGDPIVWKKAEGLVTALDICVLCNHAELVEEEGMWKVIGDPTEGALLVAAKKAGIEKQTLEARHPFLQEVPFDSERKRMSVLRKQGQGARLYVKGAPEVVLKQAACTEAYATSLLRMQEVFAREGLRVLALAYKEVPEGASSEEEGLTMVGLVAMHDPPRPEAEEALVRCKQAGVRCVMVTGDHHETAVAVAREIGLLSSPYDETMTGSELDLLSVEELSTRVERVVVYSRVSAQHKFKIVRAWRLRDCIVAMTGDGVNDALALKEADIGIAMGRSGTDVTKEVSDLVLLDDHFASLVNGIEEGRAIYRNIVKFVLFLLTSNIAEILVIFFAVLLGWHDPQGVPFLALLPIQLLWINLITDGFPAIALGFDPVNPRTMRRPPRAASDPILSKPVRRHLVLISLLVSIGTLVAAWSGLRTSSELGHTMAFVTIVFLELVEACMIRRHDGMRFFSNRWFLIALFGSFAAQLAVVYLPFLQHIFGTVPLHAPEWGVILLILTLIGILQRFITLY